MESEKSFWLRESVPFSPKRVPAAFRQLCEQRIFPRVKITGYKQDKKRELLSQQAFELVRTGLRSKVVADGRGTSNAKESNAARLWDSLAGLGFCLVRCGSEEAQRVARYVATDRLLDLRDDWTPDLIWPEKRVERHPKLLGLVVFKKRKMASRSLFPLCQ